jgi:hypothetical protein
MSRVLSEARINVLRAMFSHMHDSPDADEDDKQDAKDLELLLTEYERRLTNRELATVLAALRFWQSRTDPKSISYYGDAERLSPLHFEDEDPLDAEEIGTLCERLNK